MKTFNITVHIGTEEFEVEAENEGDALDQAWDVICQDYGKDTAKSVQYIVEEV
jgi:hypothetical protein